MLVPKWVFRQKLRGRRVGKRSRHWLRSSDCHRTTCTRHSNNRADRLFDQDWSQLKGGCLDRSVTFCYLTRPPSRVYGEAATPIFSPPVGVAQIEQDRAAASGRGTADSNGSSYAGGAASAGSTAPDVLRGGRLVRTRTRSVAAARLPRSRRHLRSGAPTVSRRKGTARARPAVSEHLSAADGAA